MPIGNYNFVLYRNRLLRVIVRALGNESLHTYLRLSPLLRFFRKRGGERKSLRILEVGCGSGTNLFELSKQDTVEAMGYDIDEEKIKAANRIRRALAYDKLSFLCEDALEYDPHRQFDSVLLMDVLEHLEKPKTFLEHIDKYLHSGGHLIISVPTPWYPRIFGRKFHDEIGHLVDGYRLEELTDLMPEHYILKTYEYNTGPFTWPGCFLYYRYIRTMRTHYIRLLLGLMLIPFKWIDILNGEKYSASLFAVYMKS